MIVNLVSKLSRAVRRSDKSLAHLHVRVYTRTECCCCHNAVDLLESYRTRYGYMIELVDVDGDPALTAQHGLSVPVVEIAGKVRFRGVVNAALLERLLTAALRERTKNEVRDEA